MTWEPRLVPKVTPETEPYWESAAEESFLVQECNDCGLVYFYPRHRCPDCHSSDVDWRESDGVGSVYSYSVMEEVSGWPESKLPLILAYIELREGPRVVSNVVDCGPDEVEIGMETTVRFIPTEKDGISVPVFAPKDLPSPPEPHQ